MKEFCLFCYKFESASAADEPDDIYDSVLLEARDFVLVPDRGSILPGYLLLIPRDHFLAMSCVPERMLKPLDELTGLVRRFHAESGLGETTMFEHGSCAEHNRAGGCIAHAHWHIVPAKFPFPFPLNAYRSYRDFYELWKDGAVKRPYQLMINETGRCHVHLGDSFSNGRQVPSQFFRRHLAQAVGVPEQWDFHLNCHQENVAQTIKFFRRWQTTSESPL